MRTNLTAYFTTLVAFLLLETLWFGVFSRNFYQTQIGSLLLAQPNLGAAALFYLLYIGGITVFVVRPAFDEHSLARAIGLGAFFGLVGYGTFDLTNLAILKDWNTTVVAVDMIWGAFETALAASVAVVVLSFTTP